MFFALLNHIPISIHTTLAGGDDFEYDSERYLKISIHTTLAGGDISLEGEMVKFGNFNPHHPRGWRHDAMAQAKSDARISIHTTLAGGDGGRGGHMTNADISIHTTLAGGDLRAGAIVKDRPDFNPHHPRGWRRCRFPIKTYSKTISIHTTLAGGDLGSRPPGSRPQDFNPHHPRGWRQYNSIVLL